MCDYLYTYAAKFDLFQHICFDTSVVSVKRRNGGHALILQDGGGRQREIWCDAVAVCSGLHVIPDMPHVEGIERAGTVLHSSEVKSRAQFGVDKNVIVLGAGETAMDLAYLAVTSPTKSVTICHRDGFFCGPKVREHPQTPVSARLQHLLTLPDHPEARHSQRFDFEPRAGPAQQAHRLRRRQPF